MNFVIYGEEKLLMEQRLNALKKQFQIDEQQMNLTTYYGNEMNIDEMIEDALTPPFFSDYKMIVFKNPIMLTTAKQKEIEENDVKKFIDFIKQDNPSTIFVVYHDIKNFDERKKIVKELRKNSKVYEIDHVSDQQLYKITHSSIINRGCTIDDDALELLLSRLPNNLLEISQEVNKLCLFTDHITKDDVNVMVSKRIEDDVFELTKAILNRNSKRSIEIYKDLKTNNEEPIKLIILIGNSIRLLYQVKLLDRKGYNDQEIGKMLGINPYRLKYIRNDSNNYELSELLSMLNELSLLDVQIKTGKIDRYKGLELFLIKQGGKQWNL